MSQNILKRIQSTKVDSTCRSCEWSNGALHGSLCLFPCKTSSFRLIFLHMQPTRYPLPFQECITVNGDNVLSSEMGGRLKDPWDSPRLICLHQGLLYHIPPPLFVHVQLKNWGTTVFTPPNNAKKIVNWSSNSGANRNCLGAKNVGLPKENDGISWHFCLADWQDLPLNLSVRLWGTKILA